MFEQSTRLTERVHSKVNVGRDDSLALAKKVNHYQSRIKDVTRKMMSFVSELAMKQADTMKLQEESKTMSANIMQCYARMEQVTKIHVYLTPGDLDSFSGLRRMTDYADCNVYSNRVLCFMATLIFNGRNATREGCMHHIGCSNTIFTLQNSLQPTCRWFFSNGCCSKSCLNRNSL